ncbi:hypothetical protein ACT009_16290 [Sphingomonas sp. Tas61C01]|uniref:hypothetical protein n=1 Tax=Sphingomonas sp. Tas61C01 TaxID=3458297 RepID=UPI00403ED19C
MMTGLIKKAGLGIALAATAITAAAPADAQRWRGGRHYHRGGGNAAAGALLGGIVGLGVGAAIASSNRDRYYDRGGYDRGYYDRGGYGYAPPPRAYYDRGYGNGYGYGDGYDYRPRCWTQRQWDPYYGRPVRVRVCN